jgi:hypothetical protein
MEVNVAPGSYLVKPESPTFVRQAASVLAKAADR